MEKYCPIISETVDSKLIRVNAFFILVTLIFYFLSPFSWAIYIVAIDFLIRVIFGMKYSPVCKTIRYALDIAKIEPYKVNAGPKRIASRFGLTFSMLIIIFQILNFELATEIVTVVFIVATGLEAFLNFCLVCKIYPYLNIIGIK